MPVTWETRASIQEAYEEIYSIKKPSSRDFSLPPTIERDFERQLEYDHPNHFTFEQIENWYNQENHKYIRAAQTAIDWKSKIGNSDMSTNFKVAKKDTIHKGDMVIREDGVIYLLNWNVQNHPNNWSTQSTECNANVEFVRRVPDKTDDNGMQIVPAHTEIISSMIPCIHTEYAGRPDYAAAPGVPGINADHLISVNLQWNEKTKNIMVNDEFTLGVFTYRVINISIAEVQIDQEYGILTLNAKRIAGGVLSE